MSIKKSANSNYSKEQIVQEFHRQVMFYSKGIYPRKIKDISKSKYIINNGPAFDKFIMYLNRNNGHINYVIMIKALAEFNKGYFSPMLLSSPKGIKIYKAFVKANLSTDKNIIPLVKESIKHIKNSGYTDFDKYILKNKDLIPTLCLDLYNGSISPYLLILYPNIVNVLKSTYPKDIVNEYLKDFINDEGFYKSKIKKYKILVSFSNNFDNNFKKLMKPNK